MQGCQMVPTFSNQKSQFGHILEGLAMEDVADSFYGHLVYFVEIWYILFPFEIVYGHLVIFSRLGKLHEGKSGNPGPRGKVVNVFTPRV
jgi:hypothetical protein